MILLYSQRKNKQFAGDAYYKFFPDIWDYSRKICEISCFFGKSEIKCNEILTLTSKVCKCSVQNIISVIVGAFFGWHFGMLGCNIEQIQ